MSLKKDDRIKTAKDFMIGGEVVWAGTGGVITGRNLSFFTVLLDSGEDVLLEAEYLKSEADA